MDGIATTYIGIDPLNCLSTAVLTGTVAQVATGLAYNVDHQLQGLISDIGFISDTKYHSMTKQLKVDSDTVIGTKDVSAEVYFMARDAKYDYEKPYAMRYDPGPALAQTNIDMNSLRVRIRDLRPRLDTVDWEVCGFQVMHAQTPLEYEDFADRAKIIEIHLPAISRRLLQQLRAQSVRIFDYGIRRRHPTWPISTGKPYANNQPALRAHIDMTYDSAYELIKASFPEDADAILKGPWQIVNIWHPLRGPSMDWPLALCDASTINFDRDSMPGDVVDRNGATENTQINHHPCQEWYYLSDHQPSETLIFKNADYRSWREDRDGNPGCPHSSFANPLWKDDQLRRESIEMRALVTYGSEVDFRDPGDFQGFRARLYVLRQRWHFKSFEFVHHRSAWEKRSLIVSYIKCLKESVVKDSTISPDDWRSHALLDIEFAELINDTGWYLFEIGFIAASCEYFRIAQRICQAAPQPYSNKILQVLRDTYNCLGTALAELNDPRTCLMNQQAWLAMMEERHGDDGAMIIDYELAQAYNELGVGYACNQMWIDAMQCFEKSMNIVKQQAHFEDFHLGWSAPNLAYVHWILGNYHTAEAIFEHILTIYKKKFGKDDLESFKTGKMLQGMGNVLWSMESYDRSFEFHERALRQYRGTVGEAHHRTAAVQIRIAEHYARQRIISKALLYIDMALRTFDTLGDVYINERARAMFKKSCILAGDAARISDMRSCREIAIKQYAQIKGAVQVAAEDLTMEHFEALVAFWSR